MTPNWSALLVGPDAGRRRVHLGVACALFVVTLAAYAVGVFGYTGGVVFVPWHAAVVGFLGAAWVGARRGGLLVAWLTAYAPFLGALAEWDLFRISARPLTDRLAAIVSPDGLVFFGVEALVVCVLGVVVGVAVRRALDAVSETDASV